MQTINKAVNETVATKADLEVMATKMAAKMATKEELGALATKMATKDDIKALATKDELKVLTKTVEGIQENIDKNMATKADLLVLEKTVKADIANLEARMMKMMWFQTTVLVGMLITVVVKLL